MARTRMGQTSWVRNNAGPRSPRAGKKQITRPRNKRFKLKKLLPQSKRIQVKKNGQIVRTMKVNRKAYYFNGNTKRT